MPVTCYTVVKQHKVCAILPFDLFHCYLITDTDRETLSSVLQHHHGILSLMNAAFLFSDSFLYNKVRRKYSQFIITSILNVHIF